MRRSVGILPSSGVDTGMLDRIRGNTADIDDILERLDSDEKAIASLKASLAALEARVKALETP